MSKIADDLCAEIRAQCEAAEHFKNLFLQCNIEIEDLKNQLAQARKDAKRYRFIRSEHERIDPVCRVVVKKLLNRHGYRWGNVDCPDETIDEAMLLFGFV